MDVHGLEAFWWVAQTGSFNRAAERLYLTQPSVTARIQALERELGQPLFERKPRGVRLTDAGRTLLPHTEKVLQELSKARRAVADLQTASGGTLAIGAALVTGGYVLPEVLGRFRSAHPKVEVNLRTATYHQVQQLVLDDTVQVGLVHSPTTNHPDVDAIILQDEEILLVANPAHPLAQYGEVPLEDLQGLAFVAAGRGSHHWTIVEQFLSACGLVPRIALELDGIEAAKQAVCHDLGISLLPVTCITQEVNAGSLVILRLASTVPRLQTMAIFRRNRIWSGVSRAFLQTLEDIYHLNISHPAEAAE